MHLRSGHYPLKNMMPTIKKDSKNEIELSGCCIIVTAYDLTAQAATVATVNGTAIDSSAVDTEVKALVSAGIATDSPVVREQIRSSLINREIMLQEARRRGFRQNSRVSTTRQALSEQLLQNALLDDIVKKPIIDADAKKLMTKWQLDTKAQTHTKPVKLW